MSCKRIDNGLETVVKLEGTLDDLTVPEFKTLVDQLVAEHRRDIILDTSSMRQIESEGVGVIVSLVKQVRADGGQVRVIGLRDGPRAIFRLLRLDRMFPV
ncbi:STAS domain-containing protein [Roseateles albus]|uniref:STAS domain-containing protein n=1 Tax=Roseateles albus TaxID=2987525 RepID=A0ABT5KAZ6_9BURK|nr:STAS domain-containing protein [Roseateles albus]MDC8771110.1 STAS domain-containing protein [Roseateles albus]